MASTPKSRKSLGLIVGSLILALILGFIAFSSFTKKGDTPSASGLTVVKGYVGSEKEAFFNDPEVKELFNKNGLDVQVSKAGSWEMAEKEGLTQSDFGFPASEVAAQHIKDVHGSKVREMPKPFFSPIAIATFKPVMEILKSNGVASEVNGTWTIDMQKYLDLASQDKRWRDLNGSESYPSPRTVMMTTTDVRSSNSASMYLALASYTLNGEKVVSSVAQGAEQGKALAPLFVNQGFAQSSSAAPFENYLSRGAGETPMVVIYESQFFEEQTKPNSRINDSMVLAYPSPTIFSTHTATTFTENGDKVMALLSEDPRFAELEVKHGFRPNGQNSGVFDQIVADKGISNQYRKAGDFLNLATMPSYDVMNEMLKVVSNAYTTPIVEESTGASTSSTSSPTR